jgi:F-type H+-transporting ATPase subunit gamma
MANLKEVRNRITSVSSTQQITKAMKMVAAAKLRKAQDAIIQMRPYAEKLDGILKNVSSSLEGSVDNPYGVEREVEKVLVVVFSSDRGLCGAFNTNVFKTAKALIAHKYQRQHDEGNVVIKTIGKKAYEHFERFNAYVTDDSDYQAYSDNSFDRSKDVAEKVMKSFVDGEYDAIEVVYNEFKNAATQELKAELFLPVVEEQDDELSYTPDPKDYIFEPSKEYIIQDLIPKSLKITFYKALLESHASENGSRMTAMDKATDNAGELLKDLKLTYNRARQAAITTEILEIVGGAEALANG